MVSVMGRKPKEENKNITRWPNHLKEMRETFGLTQEDFSNTLNVSRVSISNWENGTGGKMSKNNQEKIAKLFGISTRYIYDIPLDNAAKEAILNARVKIHLGEQVSHGSSTSSEANPYHYVPKASNDTPDERKRVSASTLLKECSFKEVVEDYMNSVKLLVALINDCDARQIELTLKINEQLSNRLKESCLLRKKEIETGDELKSLLDTFESIQEHTIY